MGCPQTRVRAERDHGDALIQVPGPVHRGGNATVDGFVAELLRDELLVVRDDSIPPDTRSPLDSNGAPAGPYEAMSLERYTDLADLILLDPVHDVSDAGSPQAPH